MSIAPITDKQRKYVIEDLKFDEVQMQNKIKHIKEWMKKQPHFPQFPDKVIDPLIYAFLGGTKLNTEKAKIKLDTYYAMRHQIPEIFLNRDPIQKDVRESVASINLLFLSELTPDAIRVTIFSFNPDKRMSGKDIAGLYKRMMAVAEARIRQGEFCCGEYVIIDCRGFYFSHLKEMPWILVQRFNSLIQDGLPIRVKGIFLINAAPFVDTALNIVRPIIKEKIRKRIHIFQGDHTCLYKYIPQRILPKDYGGDAPSLEECSRDWQRTIESMRDFFIEDDLRMTDESKRPQNSAVKHGQMFGMNGTFNKLNID